MNRKKYLKIKRIVEQYEKDKNIKKAMGKGGLTFMENLLVGRLCKKIFYDASTINGFAFSKAMRPLIYKLDKLGDDGLKKDLDEIETEFYKAGQKCVKHAKK